jgi:predicted negative regulator of RcsB-dependent stress response
MKSERRHELQHNELAEWIVKTGQAVKPYQNLLVAALVIVVVALVAYSWWSRNTAEQTAQAWNDLDNGLASGNLDLLSKVAEDYSDTHAGRVATVLSADLRLAGGCNQRFVNKAVAEQELTKAIELYESDLKPNASDFMRQRSTFGLARAQEAKGTCPRQSSIIAKS